MPQADTLTVGSRSGSGRQQAASAVGATGQRMATQRRGASQTGCFARVSASLGPRAARLHQLAWLEHGQFPRLALAAVARQRDQRQQAARALMSVLSSWRAAPGPGVGKRRLLSGGQNAVHRAFRQAGWTSRKPRRMAGWPGRCRKSADGGLAPLLCGVVSSAVPHAVRHVHRPDLHAMRCASCTSWDGE
jgi:hypothetical protein